MIHTTTTSTTTSITTTMNFKSRTAFKKTAARKIYDRRRTVRFHTQVAVYHKKYVANEATSSSWLTMLEYGGIQTGVFDTLDQLRKKIDRQAASSTVEYYCPRGLEDYCRTNHGSLQPHVLARRKHVVTAVLHEQAAQLQQQRRGRFQFPHDNDVDDATRIRQVSEASSQPHRHIAVTRGAVDSQAALTIYAEQQQQQQQPRPPQHVPPHMQRDEMYQQHPLTSSQNVVTPPVTPKKCFHFNTVDELMLS